MSSIAIENLSFRVIPPTRLSPAALPVVLLHGLMGFSANWGKIWPVLCDRPVLVFDQRGHGRSFKPTEGYSPDDYARDLLCLMDHLQWNKAHIVGHSMGGRVALRFASTYSDRSSSLVMEDSGVLSRPERVRWIQFLLNQVPTPFSDRASAKLFFEENYKEEAITGSFLHANIEQKEDGTFDWRFQKKGMIETIQTGRAQSALSEFMNLRLPILLIRGSLSKEFPEEEALQMCAAQDLAHLVTLEGAGHYVHAEKPKEFSQALLNFLLDHDGN